MSKQLEQLLIFVVEDDRDINGLVTLTLKNAGFDVHAFYATSSVLKCVKTERPAAIVLDLMLPGETGLELLQRLRMDEHCQTIGKIMLSARDSVRDKATAFELGADEYITKPFLLQDLVRRVKTVVSRTTGSE